MKKMALLVVFACSMCAAAGLDRTNISRVYLNADSGVQKSAKWGIADNWWRGIGLKIDDPSTTYSDSCGVTIVVWGWSKNKEGWSATLTSDSCRIPFVATPRLYKTAWDTIRNSQNAMSTQLIDTAIVVADSLTSVRIDNVLEIFQFSPAAVVDTVQLWFYPNSRTKKGASLVIRSFLNQVNPKNW
jgi:hypothetical protein